MKIQIRMIAALAALLAIGGAGIGCKSNGGPWHNPSSYSFYNPFSGHKDEDLHAKQTDSSVLESQRPSLSATPDIKKPMGGYASQNEAPAFKGNTQSSPSTNSIAGSGYNPAQQIQTSPYSATSPYAQPTTAGTVQPASYQPATDPNRVAMAGGYGTASPTGYSSPEAAYDPAAVSQAYAQPQSYAQPQAYIQPQTIDPVNSQPYQSGTGYPANPQNSYAPQGQPGVAPFEAPIQQNPYGAATTPSQGYSTAQMPTQTDPYQYRSPASPYGN